MNRNYFTKQVFSKLTLLTKEEIIPQVEQNSIFKKKSPYLSELLKKCSNNGSIDTLIIVPPLNSVIQDVIEKIINIDQMATYKQFAIAEACLLIISIYNEYTEINFNELLIYKLLRLILKEKILLI